MHKRKIHSIYLCVLSLVTAFMMCYFSVGTSYAHYTYTREKQIIINGDGKLESNIFFEEGCQVILKDWVLSKTIPPQKVTAQFTGSAKGRLEYTVQGEYAQYFTVSVKYAESGSAVGTDIIDISAETPINIEIAPVTPALSTLADDISPVVEFKLTTYNQDGTAGRVLQGSFVWNILAADAGSYAINAANMLVASRAVPVQPRIMQLTLVQQDEQNTDTPAEGGTEGDTNPDGTEGDTGSDNTTGSEGNTGTGDTTGSDGNAGTGDTTGSDNTGDNTTSGDTGTDDTTGDNTDGSGDTTGGTTETPEGSDGTGDSSGEGTEGEDDKEDEKEKETGDNVIEVIPAQTDVDIILCNVEDVFGVDGKITYTNKGLFSQITADNGAGFGGGSITEDIVFIYDSKARSGEVGLNVDISPEAQMGDECVITFRYQTSDMQGVMSEYIEEKITVRVITSELPTLENVVVTDGEKVTIYATVNYVQGTRNGKISVTGGLEPYTKVVTGDKIYILPYGGSFLHPLPTRDAQIVTYMVEYPKDAIPSEVTVEATSCFSGSSGVKGKQTTEVKDMSNTTFADTQPHTIILSSDNAIDFDIIPTITEAGPVVSYTVEYYNGESYVPVDAAAFKGVISQDTTKLSLSTGTKYPRAGVYRMCLQMQQGNNLSIAHKTFFVNYR